MQRHQEWTRKNDVQQQLVLATGNNERRISIDHLPTVVVINKSMITNNSRARVNDSEEDRHFQVLAILAMTFETLKTTVQVKKTVG
jgi:hypothetical protein